MKSGDRLFIIKRKDGAGFTFIKLEMINRLMDKIRTDEDFFVKLNVLEAKP